MLEYASIEIHYNTKQVNYCLEKAPHLRTSVFVIQQKLDGANLSLAFNEDDRLTLCTRHMELEEKQDFLEARVVLAQPRYMYLINKVREWKRNNKARVTTINMFGELYGGNIQKRIDYGLTCPLGKELKFFDVYFDRVIQSQKVFYEWMAGLGLSEFCVEDWSNGSSFDEALNSLERCKSLVSHRIEGVVIQTVRFSFSPSILFEDQG